MIIARRRNFLVTSFALFVMLLIRIDVSFFFFLILQVRALHTAATQNAEARVKTFSVYRWNPDKLDEKPYMQKYKVDLNA